MKFLQQMMMALDFTQENRNQRSTVVFAATICLLRCKWNEREVEDKEVKEGSKQQDEAKAKTQGKMTMQGRNERRCKGKRSHEWGHKMKGHARPQQRCMEREGKTQCEGDAKQGDYMRS